MTKPLTIHREDTILTVTFHRDCTDAEQRAHLQAMHEVMEEGKPSQIHRWVVINDVRTTVFGSPVQRRQQADWMRAHDNELRHRTAGIGFVLTSSLVRGGLTAVFWLAPLPAPHGVFATMPEAVAWAQARSRIPIGSQARPLAVGAR